MRARQRQQRDLFLEERNTPEVPAPLRTAIIRLIEGLLVEALAGDSRPPVATSEIGEAAHEQDHA
jgi:hypothetical protein